MGCSSFNNALQALVAILKAALLLWINSLLDFGGKLLLILLAMGVTTLLMRSLSSRSAEERRLGLTLIVWAPKLVVVLGRMLAGDLRALGVLGTAQLAVVVRVVVLVVALTELLEHLHEEGLHTIVTGAWGLATVVTATARLHTAGSHGRLMMIEHTHVWWWHEASVKVGIVWHRRETRHCGVSMVAGVIMEGTHSPATVLEAAVAFLLRGLIHAALLLTFSQVLIITALQVLVREGHYLMALCLHALDHG